MRTIWVGMVAVILLATVGGEMGRGQYTPPQAPGMNHTNDEPAIPPNVLEHQEQARQTERQKKLVADTDKLLALANELKTDVSKTNKDVLSIDVIKKADEIEKLAHSVKERMKG